MSVISRRFLSLASGNLLFRPAAAPDLCDEIVQRILYSHLSMSRNDNTSAYTMYIVQGPNPHTRIAATG